MGKSFQVDHIEQWLELHHEPQRVRPWCIAVSGYIRAEFENEADARHVIDSMVSVWRRYVDQGTTRKAPPKRSTGR